MNPTPNPRDVESVEAYMKMIYVGARSIQSKQGYERMIREGHLAGATRVREELSGLLAEARDWLCPHADAMPTWNKPDRPGRVWCCDCSNYIRREEDVTLIARIESAIGDTVNKV